MNPTLRNILAIIAGIAAGSVVNMGIVMISGSVIPPPEGVDATTYEGLKASMHLMEPKHFVFPFLAHAIGTLAGAFLAARLSVSKMRSAFIVGGFFLLGGIANTMMLPSPVWFSITDLVGAYLPMAWLGGKAGTQTSAA
ncbi:MAG: hypothetical protein ACO1G7_06445 [Bacteroidota bacterium]|nr:hypothetical protein [Bacteroidia bacterium]